MMAHISLLCPFWIIIHDTLKITTNANSMIKTHTIEVCTITGNGRVQDLLGIELTHYAYIAIHTRGVVVSLLTCTYQS